MGSVWTFVRKPSKRLLAWLVGVGTVVAAGMAVVTYLWPSDHSLTTVCAQQGSIAAGRDASGNKISGVASGNSGGSVACVEGVKK